MDKEDFKLLYRLWLNYQDDTISVYIKNWAKIEQEEFFILRPNTEERLVYIAKYLIDYLYEKRQ